MQVSVFLVSALARVSLTLAWLEDFSTPMGVGLATAVMDRLCQTSPPPPTQLNKALKEIKRKQQLGWSLTPMFQAGEMWKGKKEARVVTVTVAS